MSTIRETVHEVMKDQGTDAYLHYAEPVIEALCEREYAMRDTAVRVAVDQGLQRPAAEAAVDQIGLEERPAPVQATVPNTPGDEADIMATLRQVGEDLQRLVPVVNGLADFARQNGYTGPSRV